MRRHIEKIKKKPEHEIKNISIVLAVIATLIIVVIWIVILVVKKESSVNVKSESDFNVLMNNIDNMNSDFVNIKNKMNDIKIIGNDNIKK